MAEQENQAKSGLAIAGLVLGIVAIAGSFIPIINNLSFFIALVGAVLAIIALVGALRGKHGAKGMSIAGVVICVLSMVIVLATQSAFKAALDSAKTGGGSSAPVSTSQTEDAPGDSSAVDSKDDKAEEADFSNMGVGQSVDLKNGLSITVNSAEPGPDQYDGTHTVRVSVTYTNNGSSNESFNIFDWKAVDENGVEKGSTYVMDDGDRLESGKLNPGGTVTGNVYFEGDPVKVLYYSNLLQTESQVAWNIK